MRYSARPPLLPLLLALLERLGCLELFPVVLQAAVHLTTLALYRHLRGDYPARVALAAAVACGFNFTWRRLSLDLMADVLAACLLTGAVLLWRRAGERRGLYAAAGLLAGASALTQQTALLLPVPALASLLWPRRRLDAAPIVAAAVLFLLPTACWAAIKWLLFGTPGDVLVSHWSVLALHADALDDYLYSSVSFLGLPAALLAGLGGWRLCRRARHDPPSLFVVSLAAVVLFFFAVCYDHTSKRFLCYLLPVAAVALAEGLARIRSRAVFSAVAGLAVSASLMPAPAAESPTHAALWPLPPTYLAAEVRPHRNGGTAVELRRAQLETRRLPDLVHMSLAARLRRHRAEPLATPLPPAALAGDRAAIFLYAPAQAGQRAALAFRLGVAVRKRVHFLPFTAFPPAFFERRLRLSELARDDRLALYRAHLPGLEEPWLIAASAGNPVDRELTRHVRGDGEVPLPLPALARARRLAERVGEDRPVVFLDRRGRDPWRLYLPFLLPSAELFFVEPERIAGARAIWLTRAETLAVSSVAGVRMTRVRLLGRPWVVLETPDFDRIGP